MFKSLREFTLDKPVNRKRLKIAHTREGHSGVACTVVQLWNTVIVHRVNVNNITTLNSGGWKTASTKIAMNTALKEIFGRAQAPHLYQSKGKWYVAFIGGHIELFFDGMVIGGGAGAPFQVLN